MTLVTDNFDRAASTGLGANWAEEFGDFEIAGSTLVQTNASGSLFIARWNGTAMASDNYYIAASVRSPDNSRGAGVAGRQTSAARTCYTYLLYGGDFGYISRWTTGSETIIATGAAVSASTYYAASLSCSGSIISASRGGTFDASAGDGNHTTGNVCAATFGGYTGGGSGSFSIDDWQAEDLAAGTAGIWGRLIALELNRLVLP